MKNLAKYLVTGVMMFSLGSYVRAASAPDAKNEKTLKVKASGKMVCTSGSQVSLANIKSTPQLEDNLRAFMDGVMYEEGKVYVRSLKGERKDPGACRGFLGTSIDLAKCEKYKPAGESRMQVKNGVLEYLADGRYPDKPVAIPVSKICSDGKTFVFDFLYDQKFSIVKVGPWDYKITTTKEDDGVVTHIRATVVTTGEDVVMNQKPIQVGKLEVETL